MAEWGSTHPINQRRLSEARLDKIWKDFNEQFDVQGYVRADLTGAHASFHNDRAHVFFAARDRVELSRGQVAPCAP